MATAPYSWLPKRKVKEYEHARSIYYDTYPRPNYYHVHPDWVSEENYMDTPTGLRRYRPWPFEFQGARFYPWMSREKRWAEETAAREAMEEMEVIGEKDPVTDQERNSEFPRVPVYLTDHKPPWDRRPQTSGGPTPPSYSRYMRSTQNLPHPISPADRPVTSSQAYRRPSNPDPQYTNPLFDPSVFGSGPKRVTYDPIVRLEETNELRDRALLISKCADEYQPKDGRPRFERPYMNFANAMWMKYPPDTVY